MTKLAPSQAQRCPACGGSFTVTSPAKKKKIQCPRCRTIVSSTAVAQLPPREDAGGDLPLASQPAWKAECEILRARIEHLESKVESMLRSARLNSVPAGQPMPSGSTAILEDLEAGKQPRIPPIAESPSATVHAGRPAPPTESAPASSRNAAANSIKLEEIALLTTPNNSGNVGVAELLTSILTQARWKVRCGWSVRNGVGATAGLTLTASPALSRQRLSHTFTALSAAGFSVTLHLDQNLQPSETTLLVGCDVDASRLAPSECASGGEPSVIAEVA